MQVKSSGIGDGHNPSPARYKIGHPEYVVPYIYSVILNLDHSLGFLETDLCQYHWGHLRRGLTEEGSHILNTVGTIPWAGF